MEKRNVGVEVHALQQWHMLREGSPNEFSYPKGIACFQHHITAPHLEVGLEELCLQRSLDDPPREAIACSLSQLPVCLCTSAIKCGERERFSRKTVKIYQSFFSINQIVRILG